MPTAPELKAYLLTWRTYGTWLPGDERGWIDERRNGFGEPTNRPDFRLENAAKGQMSQGRTELDSFQRVAIDAVIREACEFRRWELLALNVRTNHVHAVISSEEAPARVLNALKARATRKLRENGSLANDSKLWARGGSTRILWDDLAVEAAIDYVTNRQ